MRFQLLTACLLTVLTWHAAAESFSFTVLGKNGTPIVGVKAAGNDAALAQAQRDFAAMVRAATKIEDYRGGRGWFSLTLAIVGEDNTGEAEAAMAAHQLNRDILGDEGFLLHGQSNRKFILCAYSGRGVLNGVYKILEKTLGVVPPRPQAGLDYPERVTSSASITAPYWEKPAFDLRGLSLSSSLGWPRPAMDNWMSRNLMNFPGSSPQTFAGLYPSFSQYGFRQIMGGHTFHFWVPFKEFGETHPEYWPLIHGERTKQWYQGGQLALGNPEVIDLVVQRMLAYVDKYPTIEALSFGYNDNGKDGFGWGEDPLCLALDSPNDLPKPGSKRPRTWSTRYIKASNQIIARINQKYPKMKMHVYAYHWEMMQPPDCEVNPNLIVEFAPLYKCCVHAINDPNCPRNDLLAEWLTKWTEKTPNVYMRDYYFASPYVPLVTLDSLQKDLQFFRERKMLGIRPEIIPDAPDGQNLQGRDFAVWLRPSNYYERAWDASGLRYFALARLAWNPDEPIEEIVNLFCRSYYGAKAGSLMAQYHLACDRNMMLSGHPGEPAKLQGDAERTDFINFGMYCSCWNWAVNIRGHSHRLFLTENRKHVGAAAMPLLEPLYQARQVAYQELNLLVLDRIEKDLDLMRQYLLFHGYQLKDESKTPEFLVQPSSGAVD
mgnify:CR=1 FL=1